MGQRCDEPLQQAHSFRWPRLDASCHQMTGKKNFCPHFCRAKLDHTHAIGAGRKHSERFNKLTVVKIMGKVMLAAAAAVATSWRQAGFSGQPRPARFQQAKVEPIPTPDKLFHSLAGALLSSRSG